jgi:hypothetical protein
VSIVASGSGPGSLVRVVPRSTLEGGTAYELWVTGSILDLQGNPLTSSEVVHFTTRRILLPDDLDLGQVFLIEPDAVGLARVLGRPGAVPSGTTVSPRTSPLRRPPRPSTPGRTAASTCRSRLRSATGSCSTC